MPSQRRPPRGQDPPTGPERANKSGAERWKNVAEVIWLGTKVVLLVGVISGIYYYKGDEFSAFVTRVFTTTQQLSIGGVIEVSLDSSSQSSSEPMEWGAYQRIADRLRIVEAHFGSQDGIEYIDIEAVGRIDLSGGYIGDGNELLYLGNDNRKLDLKSGKTLRIYTYCGPKVSSWRLKGIIRNKVWDTECKTMLGKIAPRITDNRDAMQDVLSVKLSLIPDIVGKQWVQAMEDKWLGKEWPTVDDNTRKTWKNWKDDYGADPGQCDALYAEMYARKMYWRVKGKHYQLSESSRKWLDKYPLTNEFVDDGLRGNSDGKIYEKVGKTAPQLLERACHKDIRPQQSADGYTPPVDYAVLARCIKMDPEKGKNKDQIECLPGLPRFRGVFKADPGEGDRIIIMDKKNRIVFDVDYWWSTKPWATK